MPEAPVLVRVDASAAGTTAGEVLKAAGVKDTAVARIGGELRDLATVVAEGDEVEQVPYGSEDGRAVLRHCAAHVLAQAVQELFPGTRLGIGPPVTDGFYYDFLPERPFTPEDLVAIEKKMSDIIRQRQRFSRRVVSEDDARKELADEPFKLELIGLKGGANDEASVEVGGSELTIYDNLRGDETAWKDLCRGPHLPTTRDIPAFKLMRTAAAYWRGSEKNPMLQRIYGTAWESKDALKAHLTDAGGGREARPPAPRQRARPVQLPRRDRLGARGLPPQGRGGAHGDGGVLPPAARRGGLRVRLHPAHHQGDAVRDLGPPRLVRRGHVPGDAARRRRRQAGRRLLPQADELPDAQPGLLEPGSLLPRAAAAAVRVRHRLPLREVRASSTG